MLALQWTTVVSIALFARWMEDNLKSLPSSMCTCTIGNEPYPMSWPVPDTVGSGVIKSFLFITSCCKWQKNVFILIQLFSLAMKWHSAIILSLCEWVPLHTARCYLSCFCRGDTRSQRDLQTMRVSPFEMSVSTVQWFCVVVNCGDLNRLPSCPTGVRRNPFVLFCILIEICRHQRHYCHCFWSHHDLMC